MGAVVPEHLSAQDPQFSQIQDIIKNLQPEAEEEAEVIASDAPLTIISQDEDKALLAFAKL